MVNPQRPIPPFVRSLTGIGDETVAGSPLFADLAQELLPLLRGCILLAHNSKFDYTFLRREFARCGLAFAAPTLCTVQLSRRLYPQFYKHSLESIIERHGIAAKSRHRAEDDVRAVADYLETALREQGSATFAAHASALVRPKPPAALPADLEQAFHALSDGCGAVLWLDGENRPLHLAAYRHTFSEAAHWLAVSEQAQQAASLRFLPAAGPLHALALKAQLAEQYVCRPSEKPAAAAVPEYLTVRLRSDGHGCVRAKLERLSDGLSAERPYGLFPNKKAAKRALSEWARACGLCPKRLDILPQSHPRGIPCPAAISGGCACLSDGLETHNRRAAEAAHFLPVTGWGRAHTLEITETDAAAGMRVSFVCSGGAMRLADGLWYFDHSLPALLKEKFKKERHNIRICAADGALHGA
ncbi:exonuclease domain-containing protein [Kingella potus]|uniref:exonuclease domain-containing protein n=1 Tax=Kingella potus TaxID=265175 RepID=UPI0031405754